MPSLFQYAGQAVLFALAAAFTGYFSAHLAWRELPPSMAQIKLSLVHGGARLEDCRQLTYEEISKLPPAQRRPNTCKRQRIPIRVGLSLDGEPIYEATVEPSGLSHDGPAIIYRKFTVPAGPHHIVVRLRDSKRAEGFDYTSARDVTLVPDQNLAIDFGAEGGGFRFH